MSEMSASDHPAGRAASQMDEEVARLLDAVTQVEDSWRAFRDRLAPVLPTSSEPSVGEDVAMAKGVDLRGSSPLATNLKDCTNRLHEVTANINRTQGKLEI